MGKTSKATLEYKLQEAKIFNKLLLEENKKLKEKIKELEQHKPTGRKAFDNKEVIKDMFQLYEKGYSMNDIAEHFNSLEIKTARGGAWSKSSISWIMKREKNINIVGIETYNRVLKLIAENRIKI